jgi:hypothetical protein
VERWRQALLEFDFRIEFIAGVQNCVADVLSRLCAGTLPIPDELIVQDLPSPTDPIITDQIPTIIQSVHNLLQGHHGVQTTLKKLHALGYRWPKMRASVQNFVRECHVCQRLRINNAPNHGPKFSLIAKYPFEFVSMDTIILESDSGPDGYTAIVTIVDSMSRYVKLIPVQSLESQEFAQHLASFMTSYGIPKQFYSDNHGQFKNDTITQVLKLFNTSIVHSSAYSHQEQGQVEVFNKIVRGHLDAIKLDHPERQWHMFIPFVERIINVTVNTTTGFAPAAVIFGPSCALLPGDDKTKVGNVEEWVHLVDLFQKQAIVIHDDIRKDSALRKENDNRQRPPKVYSPGSLVWLESMTRSKSQLGTPRRTGPFTVIQTVGSTVTIADLVKSGKQRDVHVSRLMDYVPSSTSSAIEAQLKGSEFFIIEKIISHSFSKSNKPNGLHNMTVEVKWLGYDDVSFESLKKNPSIMRSQALLRYLKDNSSLSHLCDELPITIF